MKSKENTDSTAPAFDFLRPPISLSRFIELIGITNVTAWRWRNAGKLQTINICGRQYVTAEEVANFNQRAKAGEFAQDHKTPKFNGKHSTKPARTKKPKYAAAA